MQNCCASAGSALAEQMFASSANRHVSSLLAEVGHAGINTLSASFVNEEGDGDDCGAVAVAALAAVIA